MQNECYANASNLMSINVKNGSKVTLGNLWIRFLVVAPLGEWMCSVYMGKGTTDPELHHKYGPNEFQPRGLRQAAIHRRDPHIGLASATWGKVALRRVDESGWRSTTRSKTPLLWLRPHGIGPVLLCIGAITGVHRWRRSSTGRGTTWRSTRGSFINGHGRGGCRRGVVRLKKVTRRSTWRRGQLTVRLRCWGSGARRRRHCNR